MATKSPFSIDELENLVKLQYNEIQRLQAIVDQHTGQVRHTAPTKQLVHVKAKVPKEEPVEFEESDDVSDKKSWLEKIGWPIPKAKVGEGRDKVICDAYDLYLDFESDHDNFTVDQLVEKAKKLGDFSFGRGRKLEDYKRGLVTAFIYRNEETT